MTETFRTANTDDLPALARLAVHSFTGRPPEYLERGLASARGGLGSVLIGETSGRPVSLCLMHSFRQWIGGAALPMMGLGLVAVSPTYRRRRAAGRLVLDALHRARERGDVASALYPFRISFYQGLGYGLAGEALQFLVPPETLPDGPERERIRVADSEGDREAIRSVYDRWIPTQTGQLERGAQDWERVLAEREAFLSVDGRGEPDGYVLVRYRSDLPPGERFLEVEEHAWLTAEARRGIYAWLASLSDQWRLIAYRAHPEEGFADVLREPRLGLGDAPHWGLWFPAATVMFGPMFRLLDVEAAWTHRRVSPESRLGVNLEIRDGQIPENDGSWSMRLDAGRVSIERGTRTTADCTLRGDISQISRIFIGAVPPSAAAAAGVIEVDRPESLPQLDAALRIPRPWTFERF